MNIEQLEILNIKSYNQIHVSFNMSQITYDQGKVKFFRNWLSDTKQYEQLQYYGYTLAETDSPEILPILLHIHNIIIRIFVVARSDACIMNVQNDPHKIQCSFMLSYKDENVKQFITIKSIPSCKIRNIFPCFDDLFEELLTIGKYIKTEHDCYFSKEKILSFDSVNNNFELKEFEKDSERNFFLTKDLKKSYLPNEEIMNQFSIDKTNIFIEISKIVSKIEQIGKKISNFENKINKQIYELECDFKSDINQINKKFDNVITYINNYNEIDKNSNSYIKPHYLSHKNIEQ